VEPVDTRCVLPGSRRLPRGAPLLAGRSAGGYRTPLPPAVDVRDAPISSAPPLPAATPGRCRSAVPGGRIYPRPSGRAPELGCLCLQDLAPTGAEPPGDALIATGGSGAGDGLLVRRTLHYHLWARSAPVWITEGQGGLQCRGYSLFRWYQGMLRSRLPHPYTSCLTLPPGPSCAHVPLLPSPHPLPPVPCVQDSPHCLSFELHNLPFVPERNGLMPFEGGLVTDEVAHVLELLTANGVPHATAQGVLPAVAHHRREEEPVDQDASADDGKPEGEGRKARQDEGLHIGRGDRRGALRTSTRKGRLCRGLLRLTSVQASCVKG